MKNIPKYRKSVNWTQLLVKFTEKSCCPNKYRTSCKFYWSFFCVRHNIGPISAANSRLLLLAQCCRLHRSSAGSTTAAFIDCSNWPTFSRNSAQYRPYTIRLSLLLWHPVPWTAHYSAMCHFYHGKSFWKWENQCSAQHWPVAVLKTSFSGQSLDQNWPPSAYRRYHSSNGTILTTDHRQIYCYAGPVSCPI